MRRFAVLLRPCEGGVTSMNVVDADSYTEAVRKVHGALHRIDMDGVEQRDLHAIDLGDADELFFVDDGGRLVQMGGDA